MPPFVNPTDAMTRRPIAEKKQGGIFGCWKQTPRGGFVLMAAPPRKKKKSGGSSGSVPVVDAAKLPMNPKTLGIVGGVVVLAIVGYIGVTQLNEHQNAAQNSVSQPIARNNPAPVVAPPAVDPNLPTSLPGNPPADTPVVPPNQIPAPGETMERRSPDLATTTESTTNLMTPERMKPPGLNSDGMPPLTGEEAPKPPAVKGGRNPLVAMIKGGVGPILGLGTAGSGSADATLFITLEDGQHIPVTTQEHQAYFRGELQKEQIEKLISRSRNFSIDNPTFERIGNSSTSLLGSPLMASQFDANSIQSFLAVVTVKKSNGDVATATGCLIHPDGGLIVPAETLKDGVDLTVEFQNQKFKTSEIEVGYSDPRTRLAFLKLPTDGQQLPVVSIGDASNALLGMPLPTVAGPMSVSIVSLKNNKVERTEVQAQPILYQLLAGETAIAVPGSWLDVTCDAAESVGKPIFNSTGALVGYTIAPSLDNQTGVIAVGAESIRPLATIQLMNRNATPDVASTGLPPSSGVQRPAFEMVAEGSGVPPAMNPAVESGMGPGMTLDQQPTDEAVRKVQQLLFAPSIANTKKGAELLTSIRWIQLGTLVKMNVGSPSPPTLLGRMMNTLGRQSLEKTEVNIATPEKADQAAVLMCVINYKVPALPLDPTGLTSPAAAQDIDMVFRLLAFVKDPKDPSGKSYLRVLEAEPMTIRVPTSFQEQGASRTMKEQLTNMYNKFHSGIRKAKRDLGKL